MNSHREPIYTGWLVMSFFVVFTLTLSACKPSTPTATLAEPTLPPEPTPTSEPTATPIFHEPILTLNPDTTDIQAGNQITILLSFNPPVSVAEAKWEIVVGSGKIEPPDGGDAVVFTAPKDGEGSAIVKVSGKTADGTSFEKKFSFNIIPPPNCQFTAKVIPPPLLSLSSVTGTINTPERCEAEIPVANAVPANGTTSKLPNDVFLWLFVYAPNGRIYPQCNDAAKGLCGANFDGKVWGVSIYLGNPNYPKCKERFYLVLVSVDFEGNKFLIDEMMKQGQANKFDGFATGSIKGSIEEVARLEVETAGSVNSCAP